MAFKKPTLPNLLRAQQRVGLDSDFEFYHPWRDYLELVINLSHKKYGYGDKTPLLFHGFGQHSPQIFVIVQSFYKKITKICFSRLRYLKGYLKRGLLYNTISLSSSALYVRAHRATCWSIFLSNNISRGLLHGRPHGNYSFQNSTRKFWKVVTVQLFARR